ncbi:hypothetical protein EYC84_002519 [Monilinia fructicola]|uniref:Transmembrane protein n=1 Tax=Monilinia fructicola TaxID=38448 RepID=A0A5M9JL21_MONFR|nr:hypothetical protein EYC84_002519 [Monilinia fructicola]
MLLGYEYHDMTLLATHSPKTRKQDKPTSKKKKKKKKKKKSSFRIFQSGRCPMPNPIYFSVPLPPYAQYTKDRGDSAKVYNFPILSLLMTTGMLFPIPLWAFIHPAYYAIYIPRFKYLVRR